MIESVQQVFLWIECLTDHNDLNWRFLLDRLEVYGTVYTTGRRVRHGGILYTVLQDHTAQDSWTPDAAPSLFAKVLIPDPDVIPEWEQPDSTNPYKKGDRVRFNGKVYESLIDNIVWSPSAYPAGWREVSA